MSRILLLMVIVLWMFRSAAPDLRTPFGLPQGVSLFVAGLLLVVLFMGLWSRVLARNIRGSNVHRSLKRFHTSMSMARLLIPIWFGVALFSLGWANLVGQMLGPVRDWPVELPGMVIGTLPAFLAWMALWWAQYPADRALREQSQLVLLNEDLPVHHAPGFASYFVSNLRLQLLFTVVPVALIILVHDLAAMGLWMYAGLDLRNPVPNSTAASAELIVQLLAIGLVVVFSPEVLRRVLATESLPDSPLRRRLEELCRRTGLKYRDILLWKTNHNMGNAAVMGLTARMRYILLSDVLLETMTDRQIEAVFAHEIGHVKHWHMGWYIVLITTLILMFFGPGQMLAEQFERIARPAWLRDDVLSMVGAFIFVATFFIVFGHLSRWFERQADVYAARMMQQREPAGVVAAHAGPHDPSTLFGASGWAPASAVAVAPAMTSQVGRSGATIFASALHRVAIVNNIPLRARNFTHGSIADRIEYLEKMSLDPRLTLQFDRTMSLIFACLLCGLLACAAWVVAAHAI